MRQKKAKKNENIQMCTHPGMSTEGRDLGVFYLILLYCQQQKELSHAFPVRLNDCYTGLL